MYEAVAKIIKLSDVEIEMNNGDFQLSKLPIYIKDIYALDNYLNDRIMLEIDPYLYNNNIELINKNISNLNNIFVKAMKEEPIIVAEAYVKKDFILGKPNTEDITNECKNIIKQQSDILTMCGFESINQYCTLEFSNPMIYKNGVGLDIIKMVKDGYGNY